jgi:hypothetical protein
MWPEKPKKKRPKMMKAKVASEKPVDLNPADKPKKKKYSFKMGM